MQFFFQVLGVYLLPPGSGLHDRKQSSFAQIYAVGLLLAFKNTPVWRWFFRSFFGGFQTNCPPLKVVGLDL